MTAPILILRYLPFEHRLLFRFSKNPKNRSCQCFFEFLPGNFCYSHIRDLAVILLHKSFGKRAHIFRFFAYRIQEEFFMANDPSSQIV